MSGRKLLVLLLATLLASSLVIVAALKGFTVVLNLRPVESVDWRGVKRVVDLYIAPGQTLNIYKLLGQAHQRSDAVKYCIRVEGNLSDYKVILKFFSLYAKQQEVYALASPNKNLCAIVVKKNLTMNEIPVDITLQGWIKARTDMKNQEQVKITVITEP